MIISESGQVTSQATAHAPLNDRDAGVRTLQSYVIQANVLILLENDFYTY